MSNKEVFFISKDVEGIVISETRKILIAKQRPSVESICKALHKRKGLTQGMVIKILQNMLATGQNVKAIYLLKHRGVKVDTMKLKVLKFVKALTLTLTLRF